MILLTITQKVNKNDAILGFYVEWIQGLAKRVDHLQVMALEKGDHDLPPEVEVISLGKEKGAGSLSMLFRFNRELLRLCRNRRPDAILAHMVPRYVLYALPIARIHKVPIDLWYTHKGVDKYLRLAHPFVRWAFTASHESFRMESPKKVVTGHGINTNRFRPPEKGERNGIVTVGRITPSKDQEILIKALSRIKDDLPRERLATRIVGEPLLEMDYSYKEQVERLIQRSSLDRVVTFEGAVPHEEMAACYGSAFIVVNASHTGSVDKVVLEAMAAGALPLTCNESFLPMLGDLKDLLVFEKNDPADLADKIIALMHLEEEKREEITRRLRRMVMEDHDLDGLMDKIISKMKSS